MDKLLAAGLVGLGIYLITRQGGQQNLPQPQPLPVPPKPPRNSPNFQAWAAAILSVYGQVASLWEPGGPFYQENVPKDLLNFVDPYQPNPYLEPGGQDFTYIV
jgi:hypothetical protein